MPGSLTPAVQAEHGCDKHSCGERRKLDLVRYALVAALMVLAVWVRMSGAALGFAPNLEWVTPAAFVGASLLGNRLSILIPLVIAVGSDVLMGNSAVLAFTWTAWGLIGLAFYQSGRRPSSLRRRLAASALWVTASTAFFYLWTNTGFWLLHRGSFYSPGWDGLADSLRAGIPFARNQLLGNIVLTPLLLLAATAVLSLATSRLGRDIQELPAAQAGS